MLFEIVGLITVIILGLSFFSRTAFILFFGYFIMNHYNLTIERVEFAVIGIIFIIAMDFWINYCSITNRHLIFGEINQGE